MIARGRSNSQIAPSASTVALASRPGGGVPTHFRYTPCIVMSSSTGDSNPRSPDYGGARCNWPRAATDAAIAKLGTPVVASMSSTSDFQHASGVHGRRPRARNRLWRLQASGRRGEERWSARLQAIVAADMAGGYSRLMDLDQTGPARAPSGHATGRGAGFAGVRATASHSSGDRLLRARICASHPRCAGSFVKLQLGVQATAAGPL
jgi:hypothetical protein